MGPPVSPEVIGRLQGIEPNPLSDPIGAMAGGYGMGYTPIRAILAALMGQGAQDVSGSPLLGSTVQMATQNPSALTPSFIEANPYTNLGKTVMNALGGANSRFAPRMGGGAAMAGAVQDRMIQQGDPVSYWKALRATLGF